MFHSIFPVLVILITAATAVFSFWKGDYAARVAGVINLINAVALPIFRAVTGNDHGPQQLIHAWVNNLDEVGIAICIATGTALAIRRRVENRREAAELEARRQKASAPV
jgi:hypothetical protein